jgi:hypothetical protein
MDPATIALVAQLALKYGPPLALKFAELFEKKTVTLDDWKAVFALADKSYESYVAPKV